jgi:hypothetical protein
MLDYGYRSKCCYSAIRLGTKTLKKTDTKIKIWICTKCKARDVDIVPKSEAQGQEIKWKPFAEE